MNALEMCVRDLCDTLQRCQKLEEENTELKELLNECQKRMTDCLYKIYDGGGQSYLSLEEEIRSLLSKVKEVLK